MKDSHWISACAVFLLGMAAGAAALWQYCVWFHCPFVHRTFRPYLPWEHWF